MPAPAPATGDVLDAPAAVTPEWLGRVLGAPVLAVACEPVGTGQVGETVRLKVAYATGDPRDAAGAPLPASLVGKFAAEDEISRAAAKLERSYTREVGFYREGAATVGIRVPRCRYAALDEETTRCTLLLEDLAPARPGDQLAGCGPDDAARAIEQAAALHAPRWGDPTLAGRPWLDLRDALWANYVGLLPRLHTAFTERYAGELDADAVRVGAHLVARLAAYRDADAALPQTIRHGDFRLDNMLFDAHDGADPLVVVDWQTVIRGGGIADVAYFLGAGLSIEDRRTHERALVREYHERLLAAGVEGWSWEDCWRGYRLHAFAGYLMAMGASMLVERTARGDAMFLAMTRRHTAQILDLDAEALLA